MPTASRKHPPEMLTGVALTAIGILCLFLSFGCLLEPVQVWKSADGAVRMTASGSVPLHGKDALLETLLASPLQKATLLALSLLASGSGWALNRRKAGNSPLPVTFTQIREKWSKLSLQQQQLFLGQIQENPKPPLPTPPSAPTPAATQDSASTHYIEAHYLYMRGETLDRAVARIWKLEIGSREHEKAKQEFTAWLRR